VGIKPGETGSGSLQGNCRGSSSQE